MIMPTKYVNLSNSLLGIGSMILVSLDKPCSINNLWINFNLDKRCITFEKFVYALDFLFVLGLVKIRDNTIECTVNKVHINKAGHEVIEIDELLKNKNLSIQDFIIPYMFRICEVLKNDIA